MKRRKQPLFLAMTAIAGVLISPPRPAVAAPGWDDSVKAARLEHPTVAPGFGSVVLMDRARHSHAAAVYINWLLSRAGQTDWGKMGYNSSSLDVEHALPEYFPKPGIADVPKQTEANIAGRQEAANLAKQFIPSQP